jgi:two-component sensor histidine kinase
MLYKVITILSIFISFAFSNQLEISKNFIYQDNQNLPIEQIINQKFKKVKVKDDYFKFGYTPNAIWHKITIKNLSNQNINKVIHIDNSMIDEVTLYKPYETNLSDPKWLEQKSGIMYKKSFEDKILTFYFDINIEANSTKTFYLKVLSNTSANFYHLKIISKENLYQNEMQKQLILTLFFGALIALIFYNTFIYAFTRDRAYLYYIGMYTFLVWNHISYTGMILYLIPFEWNKADAYLGIFYLSGISIFTILFTQEFLNTKKFPKIDKTFKLFFYTQITLCLMTYILPYDMYPLEIVSTLTFLIVFALILTSYYLYTKKVYNAQYFTIGFSLLLIGWTSMYTESFGIDSVLDSLPYTYEVSLLFEMLLFSFVLSKKINKTDELAKEIEINKELTKELNHRTKNDLTTIMSIYRIKLESCFKNKKDENRVFQDIEQHVISFAESYEIMYQSQKYTTDESINFIIKKYKIYEDIKISTNINCNLDKQKLIHCIIIINEAITNSIKYAFDNQKGEIKINLTKNHNQYKLSISDNGCGFDKIKKDTFGLNFIKQTVKSRLKGKLRIDSQNGVKMDIEFM